MRWRGPAEGKEGGNEVVEEEDELGEKSIIITIKLYYDYYYNNTQKFTKRYRDG